MRFAAKNVVYSRYWNRSYTVGPALLEKLTDDALA